MKTPEEKYLNDPEYRHFVSVFEQMIETAHFTPSELREMAIYACIRYEMRHVRQYTVPAYIDDSFRHIEDWLSSQQKKRKR